MTPVARHCHIIAACSLGWALDAFDFFIMIFVLNDIAKEFGAGLTAVTWAITLTLAVRAIGALLFGQLGDRYGRKPILIINMCIYGLMELMSGFATSLTVLIVMRIIFGIAMGGEWGLGAALMMESIPKSWRGAASGILQAGYPVGYLLAAVLYGLAYPMVSWRGLFMLGSVPAFVVAFYVWAVVPESPAWRSRPAGQSANIFRAIRSNGALFVYAILVMTAFNFFSHSTQDLYPSAFLSGQRHLDHAMVATIAIIYNLGAISGCVLAGFLSQRFGRRRTIVVAALGALVVIPFWAYASGIFWIGLTAFLMQFAVQAAYGIVPAHLNEISPDAVRSTFPGVTSQIGNLLAAGTATLQSSIADHAGGHNFSLPFAITASTGAIAVALLVWLGRDASDVDFGGNLAASVGPDVKSHPLTIKESAAS